jgi:DNA invertase Pin-like site-specific DNA recombinase
MRVPGVVSHRRNLRKSALGLAEGITPCSNLKANPPHPAVTAYATKMGRSLVLAKRTKTGRTAARAKRQLRPAAPKVARARSSDDCDITSKPMLIGYARVSTVDQNLALQRDALTEAGCAKIFTEQMSGAVTGRPALHDALEFARPGDTLIVWKLDRLARSMKQLIETVETLRLRGIGFRSLTEALDTTTAQGRLVFHMFGALAEFERSLIRERTQAGLAAARRAGRTGGRPPKLTDDDIEAAKAMLANPDIGVTQIAHRLGVSPATLYRYIPAARTANTPGV